MKNINNSPAIRENYHTHNYRCKHASGDVADYCRTALEHGLEVLGISDHAPLPDGRWEDVRMDMAELPGYCQAIDDARTAFPGLKILKGFEGEYDVPFENWYHDEILGRLGFDYLAGTVHYFPHKGEWADVYAVAPEPGLAASYAEHFIRTMASGLFDFMAHPDVFGFFHLCWDADAKACAKDMFQAARSLDIPLELNSSGFHKHLMETPDGLRHPFPLTGFWEMAAEHDVEIIINSDAHSPGNIIRSMDRAAEFADRLGLRRADMRTRLAGKHSG